VIPARYEQLVLLFFMTVLMGLLLSLIFQVQETGFTATAGFITSWLGRFAQVYIMVVPIVLLVAPVARYLTRPVLRERTTSVQS
jgi:hypothetical protein